MWKESGGTVSKGEHEEILTDVTVLSSPSLKAVTVISTNQIFASVSIFARLPHTLIHVCGLREKKSKDEEQERKIWRAKKTKTKKHPGKSEKNPRYLFVAPPPSSTFKMSRSSQLYSNLQNDGY